jgi:hypothetical protein
VLELFARGEQVDREQIEADGDAVSMLARELAEPGLGHQAELALLVFVDGGFGGGEVAEGAGFDLEDDQSGTVPGDEVEVAAELGAGPALSDDGEAETAEMKERGLFSAEASDEVRWEFGGGGSALEGFESTLLEVEREGSEAHAGRIADLETHVRKSGHGTPGFAAASGGKLAAIYLDVHTKHNQISQQKRSRLCQQSTSL